MPAMQIRRAKLRSGFVLLAAACLAAGGLSENRSASAAPPPPPLRVEAHDHPWDSGQTLDVLIDIPREGDAVSYSLRSSGEASGVFDEVARLTPTPEQREAGQIWTEVRDLQRGEPYWFRAVAIGDDDSESAYVETSGPAMPTRQWFDGKRFWLLLIGSIICGSVVVFVALARAGRTLYVRKIAGLDAIEEAVGRATEMGRACLFVPGIQDINEIQTIAGLTILSRVAERAAEYDARLEVPTSKSLVMTAARDTVRAAYYSAGRPDAYNEDAITYVTDEQFGYVAYLTGQMVREKPAACFYLGSFYAESLILAETGNSIGAIQVAGTAQPAQLPFFVAACDYTLIGEEFFAASAYLSRDPDQLGSLKGQDVGKLIVAALMIVGVGLLTLGGLAGEMPSPTMQSASGVLLEAGDYVRSVILSSG